MNTNKIFPAVLIVIAAAVFLLYSSAYIVDETEQVIVTQFEGAIIGDPITEPGLKFLVPFIQKANYFPKNLLSWDGDPGQIPTYGKTYIWVDTFARWKINDPIKFFQTLRDVPSALSRLDDIIDPAVRNLITDNRLIEAVRKSNRELDTFDYVSEEERKTSTYRIDTSGETHGRVRITKDILNQAKPKLVEFGIELVDVKIKQINYIEDVRQKVYDRMKAERKQIAELIRSEGRGEARKILGDKERKLKEITSTAYKKAQKIMGEADAKATEVYAKEFQKDPEFYSFIKTLQVYTESLDKESEMVMSTDSEFFRYLKGYDMLE